MNYTFSDISTTKFTINGRELFKTFICYYIDDNRVKILNVYDSTQPLIPTTLVSDIDIDGSTYPNATALINAIVGLLYTPGGDGTSLDNAQIEQNRVAIASLGTNKADVLHTHDDRYYTETEIDDLLSAIPGSGTATVQGDVDGDEMNFRDAGDNIIFTVDVTSLNAQATIMEVNRQTVTLKDSSGNILASVDVVPDVIDIDSPYPKTGKWVLGIKSGINLGNGFMAKSLVDDPLNDGDFNDNSWLIAK